MEIICDIDNVAADLADLLADSINQRTGDNYTKHDFDDYDVRKYYKGLTFDQMFAYLIEDKVLENCPAIPGAIEAVNRLVEMGADINFVTSRSYHPKAEQITADWLNKQGAIYKRLLISDDGDKISQYRKLGSSFFCIIDDYDENIIQAADSGMFESHILIDQPWNRSFSHVRTHRYDSLEAYANELISSHELSVA